MTSSSTTRFGVIGTGGIASAMTSDVTLLPDVEVVAVGSRSTASAERFAQAHGVPRAHGSYAELVSDPEVDAVYAGIDVIPPSTTSFAFGPRTVGVA